MRLSLAIKTINNVDFVNYTWKDNINNREEKTQLISLEPTGAKNRGNYKVAFETFDSLHDLKLELTNYYFSAQIAQQEIQNWAKLISKTVNEKSFSKKVIDVATRTSCDRFITTIGVNELTFQSGYRIVLFSLNANSKQKKIVIDAHDLFPRYYFNLDNAIAEEASWINARIEEKS